MDQSAQVVFCILSWSAAGNDPELAAELGPTITRFGQAGLSN
jgi:hypothetical protein